MWGVRPVFAFPAIVSAEDYTDIIRKSAPAESPLP